MKLRKLPALLFATLLALVMTGVVSAQTAYATTFNTSITFSNVGSAAANITITYYPESGAAVTTNPVNGKLAAGASTSVFVGNVSQIGTSFKGAAVLSSDQPVVATLVQTPATGSAVLNRALSNGFQAGTSRVMLASVLKNQFNTTTVFSVQNAGSAPATFNVTLNPASGSPIVIPVTNLPVGAAKYFDMGTLSNVSASNFNGSAVIEGNGVSLVATAMELSTNGLAVSAFEGIASGSSKVYMPSALCKFGVGGQPTETFYAIQNVGTTATTAKLTFTATVPSPATKEITTASIAPGAKVSVAGCDALVAGGSGSAIIEAASGGQLVVLGKVSGAGISSAFLGESAGSAKLSLPYVRWSESKFNPTDKYQRTFIAIQNVGGNLAANSVKVHYYNAAGTLVGTYTVPTAIAAGGKVSVNPNQLPAGAGAEFGYTGTFGGGAIVEGPAGSQLVAVVRVVTAASDGTQPGEDYNGVPVQ
jgi:hypothetical protein